MKYSKEAKSLTFRRGSEVSQGLGASKRLLLEASMREERPEKSGVEGVE